MVILTIFVNSGYARELKAPSHFHAKSIAPTAIKLLWQDNSDEENGYRIWRKNTDNGWILIGETRSNIETFTDGGVVQNKSYSYKLVAFKANKTSETVFCESAKTPETNGVRGRVIAPATENNARGMGSFVRLKNGGLLLVYNRFTRMADAVTDPGVKIVKRLSKDNGQTWSQEETLFFDPNISYGKPSVCRIDQDQLGLTYLNYYKKEGIRHADLHFCVSRNEGKTWIYVGNIPKLAGDDFWYVSSRNDVLRKVNNDRLIIPSLFMAGEKGDTSRILTAVYVSDDQGRTWQRTAILEAPKRGIWEAAITQIDGDHLFLIGRTDTGWYYGSNSKDNGNTWSKPRRLMRGGDSPPHVDRIPGTNSIVICYHPSFPIPTHGERRKTLASMKSDDGGYHFNDYRQIEYDGTLRSYQNHVFYFDKDHVHLFYSSGPEKGAESKRGDNWQDGMYLRLHKAFFRSPQKWPY
jgi:hypothetical protein